MPKIFPFRATHFDPDRVGDLSKVITQPYDKIDAALQEEYYRRHENNFVRVIRRKEEPADPSGLAKYPAAAKTVQDWLEQKILVEDPTPAFYAYFQTYRSPQGEKTRRGFVALVRADEFGKGRVFPHEQTHSGPKVDRYHLLSHVNAHLEQVFLLYSDPERKVSRLLEEVARRSPDFQATDDLGETHRLWRITEAAQIRTLQEDLERRDAIIADGHHRYETAVRYRQEMSRKGVKPSGDQSFDNVMATLVNMDDDGLTIFPTHRVVHGIPGFDPERLRKGAERYFDILEYPYAGPEEEAGARSEMLEDLRIEGLARPAFGVAFQKGSSYFTYALRDRKAAVALVKEKKSEDWRSLDVNVLHSVILESLLGMGKERFDREEVAYVRHVEEALEKLKDPQYQAAFLLNPIRLESIRKIVRNGERFPQKTTDFYPKMISGLVFCRLHSQGA